MADQQKERPSERGDRGWGKSLNVKPIRGRAVLLQLALVAFLAAWSFRLITLVLFLFHLQKTTTDSYHDHHAYLSAQIRSEELEDLAVSLQLWTFLFSAIVFVVWTYRAAGNLRAIGAADPKISPGWAIGWYFVPLLNFWKPYQAMKRIADASERPFAPQLAASNPVLPVWWTGWIIGLLLSRGVDNWLRQVDRPTFEDLRLYAGLTMLSVLASVASAAALFFIVRHLTTNLARLEPGSPAPAPA